MQRRINRFGITLAFAAGFTRVLTGCHRAEPPAATPALVIALPVHPQSGGVTASMARYPVEVDARYSNAMSFRVGGKIIERTVRLGDAVRRGQVLARLDPIDLQKQVTSNQAALAAAEHRLLFARQQLTRDQAQSERNLIAASQLEQTQDSYISAQAERDQANAQLDLSRHSLDYTRLAADHDGVITSENADTGQVVTSGQTVYGLAWTGDMDVVLDAAESELRHFAVGERAQVTFAVLPGRQFEARVREIAPAADAQSRTYRVKLSLQLPADAVRLGMTGDAALAEDSPSPGAAPLQSYRIPATALFHRDNQPAVWIVDSNSTLQLRAVEVQQYAADSVRVASGLHDGDVVVLAGVHTVYAGERVRTTAPLFDEGGEIAGPVVPSR